MKRVKNEYHSTVRTYDECCACQLVYEEYRASCHGCQDTLKGTIKLTSCGEVSCQRGVGL